MRRLCSLAIAVGVLIAGATWMKSPIGAPAASFTPTAAKLDPLTAMSTTNQLPSHQYDLY
jgi:hypothetical protein